MKAPTIRLREVRFRVADMRTRMPFKYGIASLRALPHLFVVAEVEVDGRRVRGVTAEGLPPKWFTKDPATRFEEDLAEMLGVIRNAGDLAVGLGAVPSPFAWWEALHERQAAWAERLRVPLLLAGLGTSLLERAMLDAVCRATGCAFAVALRAGLFGLDPARIHPELPRIPLRHWLPAAPVERVWVRHTVGLADPLDDGEIPPHERLDDGLPQSLGAAVRRYGLTHFKVKLCGDPDRDLERLRRVGEVLGRCGVEQPRWTLDGNEQFSDLEAFRGFWDRLVALPELEGLRSGLLLVEQPLHRATALDDATGRALRAWEARPPWIIDESDGDPGALRRALELGYAGISHKNCKGVFRGVANACLLRFRRERMPAGQWVLTSEDLATVGPVAMFQDLCVAATLGLEHSERNGHHYFRGLGMFPAALQSAARSAHPDLYEESQGGGRDGCVVLRIEQGRIRTGSVIAAPFGCGLFPALEAFTPLDEWSPDRLEL